jgi:hypothetical protein
MLRKGFNNTLRLCYYLLTNFELGDMIFFSIKLNNNKTKQTSRFLVRKRTIPTEQPALVGEVSANFSG